MRKAIAVVLVVAGIMILAYPKLNAWHNEREQAKLLSAWDEEMSGSLAEQEALDQYEGLTNLFEDEAAAGSDAWGEDALTPSVTEPAGSPSPQASAPAPTNTVAKPSAIASLKIPKIDLTLPVLEGATASNMNHAAVHLSETAAIGKVGNTAIAAHRMKKRGSLFNRLNEVEVGDSITLETKKGKFTYTVYEVLIVDPTDVSVLNYNKTDKLLTLITCDPLVNPTHRLIVHAEMDE
ncbi:class D sortase [Paenibacillus sp. HB172176]|uniref:class D sortase n=1 Tax=Paenibacillus sp. HB172176 TaxID=2493690 RepID=UPI00143C469F|nr:class D sortase [Paenibacillus sp. HB172176]